MANPWFRMYAEFAMDPKVQMLNEADQRRFVMLLCLRCSNDGVTLQDEEVAFQLRISSEQWAATKAVFLEKKLIGTDNAPRAWDKRQYRSDSSAERVSRHRAKKKQESNVTATPPEAEAEAESDTDKTLPASGGALLLSPAGADSLPAGTRKGRVCGLLRKAGMADAAPHYLTEATWEAILAKRTDEEIVELARAKMASRPGQRTGLKYLAPALMEDPRPLAASPRTAAPGRQTVADERAAVSMALTGRGPAHERQHAERDITGEAIRVA